MVVWALLTIVPTPRGNAVQDALRPIQGMACLAAEPFCQTVQVVRHFFQLAADLRTLLRLTGAFVAELRNAGDLLEVVLCAGRHLMEEDVFTGPSAKRHAYLVKQLVCIVQVLLFRRVLRIPEGSNTTRNNSNL